MQSVSVPLVSLLSIPCLLNSLVSSFFLSGTSDKRNENNQAGWEIKGSSTERGTKGNQTIGCWTKAIKPKEVWQANNAGLWASDPARLSATLSHTHHSAGLRAGRPPGHLLTPDLDPKGSSPTFRPNFMAFQPLPQSFSYHYSSETSATAAVHRSDERV